MTKKLVFDIYSKKWADSSAGRAPALQAGCRRFNPGSAQLDGLLWSSFFIYMKEFDELKKIIDKLRSPDGCPWDRKQTHDSLLPFLYEESNETGDAIINKDFNHLKEELGDLMLQILLHSRIAEENNLFTIKDVLKEINGKLIRRHPHVFHDKKAENPEEVIRLWEEIKKEEKKDKISESLFDNIPKNVDPLIRSYKLQKAASKVGFDWSNYKEVLAKINEEINELIESVEIGEKDSIEHEFGDLLFACVNLGRFLKMNSDVALQKANLRFIKRFNYIERKLIELNKKFEEMNIDELEKLWNEAKQKLD